jgi:hypothetical protein
LTNPHQIPPPASPEGEADGGQASIPLDQEAVSQFHKTVIPGEQNDVERDPESRKLAGNQVILDPGSRPAPRDLAGMTDCDTVYKGGAMGCLITMMRGSLSTPL